MTFLNWFAEHWLLGLFTLFLILLFLDSCVCAIARAIASRKDP